MRKLAVLTVFAAALAGPAPAQSPPLIELTPSVALEAATVDANTDLRAELIDLAHGDDRLVVLGATIAIPGAGGRWSPTRREAQDAWNALQAYGPAGQHLAAKSRVKVRLPSTVAVYEGREAWLVQAAGVDGRAVRMSKPVAGLSDHVILLNVVDVGMAVDVLTGGTATPWVQRKQSFKTRWLDWADGPYHPVALYDPARRQIVAYEIRCGWVCPP